MEGLNLVNPDDQYHIIQLANYVVSKLCNIEFWQVCKTELFKGMSDNSKGMTVLPQYTYEKRT